MTSPEEARAGEAVRNIIDSTADKKLIVAGPGAGKTYTFKKVLKVDSGTVEDRIVLTFLNNLRNDLEEELSEYAQVYTFHGYCHSLLRKEKTLRKGLTRNFHYFPGLPSLINRDWEITTESDAPGFIPKMRRLEPDETLEFYFARATYYDAVSYDDSIYRVHEEFGYPGNIPELDLVLVDEYQDFNKLEASFLDLLASKNPILIAGDDGQALYRQLREASPDFIRQRHAAEEYECFELPFCMRCTQVVVGSVNDVIGEAQRRGLLQGRIEKAYNYYPPIKQADSETHPRMVLAQISAQSKRVNYFGKFIRQNIDGIPDSYIAESHEKGFPTVLIIGGGHYLRQIEEHLTEEGYEVERKDPAPEKLNREDGLRILQSDPRSNLGWRIVLENDKPEFYQEIVEQSVTTETPIYEFLPDDYRDGRLAEAESWELETTEEGEEEQDKSKPTIRLTSFEGSKGLSAQYVFIIGLHSGDLPRSSGAIDDLEVCKFVVALSRTRKKCHLLHTWRFAGRKMKPSIFLDWIDDGRKEVIEVNKYYW